MDQLGLRYAQRRIDRCHQLLLKVHAEEVEETIRKRLGVYEEPHRKKKTEATEDAESAKVLISASDATIGGDIRARLASGELTATVKSKKT